MEFEELREKISRLFRHFRTKYPDSDTIGLWWEELNHIPNEAGEWIIRRICLECDAIPRNVVKAIKDLWRAYLAEHPEKSAKQETEFCEVCCGRGLLWFQYQVSGHPAQHTAFARCGHCDNHTGLGLADSIPIMTAGDIVRRGFVLDPRNNKRKTKADFQQQRRSVEFGKLIRIEVV